MILANFCFIFLELYRESNPSHIRIRYHYLYDRHLETYIYVRTFDIFSIDYNPFEVKVKGFEPLNPKEPDLQSGATHHRRCAPMRFYMFYVEAKGIEPLLEEPKSSVLPLDDASKK